MDIGTIIAAIVSSLGVSTGVVYLLAQTAIKHSLTIALDVRKNDLAKNLEDHKNELARQLDEKKALLENALSKNLEDHKNTLAQQLDEKKAVLQNALDKDLEDHKGVLTQQLDDRKALLQADLARDQALLEGSVKREVDLYLGDRAAQREYESEARKRLYLAVGPLRFQLLLACRDIAHRVEGHGTGQPYAMNLEGYYGRSTLYRLLRPFAIANLIERQVAYSDFAVDDGAVDCLRLRKSLARILSGDEIVCDHPQVDWRYQTQHVFADSLGFAANALTRNAGQAGDQILRFDEFNDIFDEQGFQRFTPFSQLLTNFQISEKPILWLRLVAYGNACNAYILHAGAALGFEQRTFPVESLLRASADEYIISRMAIYQAAIQKVELMKL
jgi:hypothetical protein